MKRHWLYLYIACIIILFGAGLYLYKTEKTFIALPTFYSPTITPQPIPETASSSAEFAVVKRVVDGDTIELTDGRKVRYIGVDTPELHHPTKGVQCFGKEAMEKNKALVEGKEIKLIRDVSETDRYKRLLRYVYVPSTSSGQVTFINEYLVREGYAHQATFPPDVKYAELFTEAAEEARVNKKGLWNACK